MTSRVDINADVGEHDGPPPAAALALLHAVTSANVSCGVHAGDLTGIRLTIAEAAATGVQVGAHPSYPDRDGFGRRVLPLTSTQVVDVVASQIDALRAIAGEEGAPVAHVKPHGALYTHACRDRDTAAAIAAAVVAVDRTLALYAPRGSALWQAGEAAGLRVAAEGFLDRAYEDDGSLTPRSEPGAVIADPRAAAARAIEWVRTGHVTTRTGRLLSLPVETLCVHGDTDDAALIARQVRDALEAAGIRVLRVTHRT